MKIGIVGHLAFGKQFADGQTIKTRILYESLLKHTDNEVTAADTCNWKKHPFRLLRNVKNLFKTCDCIIMLPSGNGVKVFAPLFIHYNKKYKRKIFYDVIGGWLPEITSKNKSLLKKLKAFDGIWVETDTMKCSLQEQGLDNAHVVPNFKDLDECMLSNLPKSAFLLQSFCTFSRVSKDKGISDAINALKALNENGIKAKLDIYGQIQNDYMDEFGELLKENSFVEYKGIIEQDKSVETLKNYYMLLFPTFYDGEGFPGTLIDAMASGLPVIASDWKYNKEIVSEDIGFLCKPNDNLDLAEKIRYCIDNPEIINNMREKALERSKKFLAKTCIHTILEQINK